MCQCLDTQPTEIWCLTQTWRFLWQSADQYAFVGKVHLVLLWPWHLTSKSNQLIFLPNCIKVVNFVKIPQTVCKILCMITDARTAYRLQTTWKQNAPATWQRHYKTGRKEKRKSRKHKQNNSTLFNIVSHFWSTL